MLNRLVLFCALVIALACQAIAETPILDVTVVNSFPHDPDAFTQGLVFHDGHLFEGTGRNGKSSIRKVALSDGEVLQRKNLGERYFGEGITIFKGKIYQLTWKSHLGFVYDLATFKQIKTFFLPGEGWGITHDGEHLIVSDGTAQLRFLDPETLKETARITVTEATVPVDRLNELEYINGKVWANVWYSNEIVRINPQTGNITTRINLEPLSQSRAKDDVLNGIAWDEADKRLFVTGKLWPEVYEINVNE